ncbi:MAG: 30S ribosomal protein S6 [Planctomycetota bacterium]|nr:30S ribosomal protein S6 [Planctomycetota bacterium]
MARETVLDRFRTYECMCLLDNREVRKGWEPLKATVAGMFTKHGAEIVSSKRWDERRLTYVINGQQRGTYLLIYFKANTQGITGLRRDLQFSDSVLRSLVLACEEVPPTAFEPEAAFDVNTIPTEDVQAVPEEVMETEMEDPVVADKVEEAKEA